MDRAEEVAWRYGIRVMIHDHTEELAPLAAASRRPYDVLVAQTDPDLPAAATASHRRRVRILS